MASTMPWPISPRSLKRSHDGGPCEDETRFVKKFNLLKIDPLAQVYLPITPDGAKHRARTTAGPQIESSKQLHSLLNRPESPTPSSPSKPSRDGEFMNVDDTPNRIFIANIDDELSDDPGVESSPSHPIFIGDIDKHLMGMPRSMQMLSGVGLVPMDNNQLVLYRPMQARHHHHDEFDRNYDADSDDSSLGSSPTSASHSDPNTTLDVVEIPEGTLQWNSSQYSPITDRAPLYSSPPKVSEAGRQNYPSGTWHSSPLSSPVQPFVTPRSQPRPDGEYLGPSIVEIPDVGDDDAMDIS